MCDIDDANIQVLFGAVRCGAVCVGGVWGVPATLCDIDDRSI